MTQWAKEGGVLLIGYELYRQLSLQKPRKRRTVNPKRKSNSEDDIDDEKYKLLLEGKLLFVVLMLSFKILTCLKIKCIRN